MNFTYKVYGDRVISLEYPKFAQAGIEWPPYSPDLNPCDFFLWGYLKDNYYAEKPKTIDDLRKAITKGVLSIPSSKLNKFFIASKRGLIVVQIPMQIISKIFTIKSYLLFKIH